MHDLYKELFKFSPDQLEAVFDYLRESSNNYRSIYQMISKGSEDYNLEELAFLIGKYSCGYMSTEELEEILIPSVSVDMHDMRGFLYCMGESFGINFGTFNYDFQTEIVKLTCLGKYSNFVFGLGSDVGDIFYRLKGDIQMELIDLPQKN
ncbi:MAG: hypothetical protein QW292_03170 [Candidatus Parvarchaeota archaeon]